MANLFMVTVAVAAGWLNGGALGQSPERPIFLPDSSVRASESLLDLRVPVPPPEVRSRTRPSCSGVTTSSSRDPCERDMEYDTVVSEYVQHLIRRDDMVSALISDPILSNLLIDVEQPAPQPIKPTTRFGNFPSESPVCDAQETLIYPQRAQSSSGDWVFVVNQEGAKQAIKVEKCINEGRPCKLGMVAPGGIKTTCRQKYVYRRMLTLNTNKLLPEEVIMPSCCVCYASQDSFDISVRIRNITTATSSPVEHVATSAPQPPNLGRHDHPTYSHRPLGYPTHTDTAASYDNVPVGFPPAPIRRNRHTVVNNPFQWRF